MVGLRLGLGGKKRDFFLALHLAGIPPPSLLFRKFLLSTSTGQFTDLVHLPVKAER